MWRFVGTQIRYWCALLMLANVCVPHWWRAVSVTFSMPLVRLFSAVTLVFGSMRIFITVAAILVLRSAARSFLRKKISFAVDWKRGLSCDFELKPPSPYLYLPPTPISLLYPQSHQCRIRLTTNHTITTCHVVLELSLLAALFFALVFVRNSSEYCIWRSPAILN